MSGGPLYDTAMIICKGVQKRSGGPLYDTAMIICKGVQKRSGGPLYDTAMISYSLSRIYCRCCIGDLESA